MKKIYGGLLILLALLVLLSYLLIPATLNISVISYSRVPAPAVARLIGDPVKWQSWWRNPDGSHQIAGTPFQFGSTRFTPQGFLSNVAVVTITNDSVQANSTVTLLSLGRDSSAVSWGFNIASGNSPWSRYKHYRQAITIKKNMKAVLDFFGRYLLDDKNIYGGPVYRSSTRDTLLLATHYTTKTYPITPQLYQFIKPLQEYVRQAGGIVSGAPMVNVTRVSDSVYETQVALPVKTSIPGKGAIYTRRMVPGNFMVIEITGGDYAVREGERNLQFYVEDFGKIKMAIAFQSLVTDRMAEPDSTKWKTRVYLPVVQ